MKAALAAFGILSLLLASFLNAQTIYKWKDEKGQWHFSQTPPAGAKAEPVTGSTAYSSRKLGRSYGGFTLGEDAAVFIGSGRFEKQKTDESGMQFFLISKDHLPRGAAFMTVAFFNAKMAFIMVFFPGKYIRSTGGWPAIIRNTAHKYGAPDINRAGEAFWADGQTALNLDLRIDGGVTASYGDRHLIDQRSALQKQLAPSF